MTVYVDDMVATFGRMKMCHMLADTEAELIEMAEKIGVARRWHQNPGAANSHFDICLSKRAIAVSLGAKQITMKDAGRIVRRKRTAQQAVAP